MEFKFTTTVSKAGSQTRLLRIPTALQPTFEPLIGRRLEVTVKEIEEVTKSEVVQAKAVSETIPVQETQPQA